MGFVRHESARVRDNIGVSQLSISINKSGNKRDGSERRNLVIILPRKVMHRMSWRSGNRVYVNFGDGKDLGCLSLELAPPTKIAGSYKLSIRSVPTGQKREDLEGKCVTCAVSLTVNIGQVRDLLPEHVRAVRPDYTMGEDDILINCREGVTTCED